MNIINYVKDNNFKLNMENNNLYIIGYNKMINISKSNIKLKYKEGIIDINGSDLLIKKLVKDEILIKGIIKNISFK